MEDNKVLKELFAGDTAPVLREWGEEVASATGRKGAEALRLAEKEAAELLRAVGKALEAGAPAQDLKHAAWGETREVLEALSRSQAAQGLSAGETSAFVLAMKKPLFTRLHAAGAGADLQQTWGISSLVDRLAQWTVNTYQQTREQIIKRQQEELLELSTPVIKLWDGILAVPMIGTLDSSRTQMVMETLLQRIVDTGSGLAIIDITGVPTVDTLVAQHLLKTVSAIRLMGAECIISGIRPQIAQTIVHLGVDLQGIATKSSLAAALSLAVQRQGLRLAQEA
jgi:rsbT co-antagonist protein RsbR